MGSPLGPVLAGICMTQLENTLLPTMDTYMLPWMRYVDDTLTAVKADCIDQAVCTLNSFHNNIQFTYEQESADQKLPFLDVLLIRDNKIETTVYKKPTTNDIYLHWNSFTPKNWRIGTLKSLLLRAHKICSNTQLRQIELDRVTRVFKQVNGYPSSVISSIREKLEEGILSDRQKVTDTETPCLLTLPYKGMKGEKLVKSMRKMLMENNIDIRTIYRGCKLDSQLSTKDKIKKEHKHNVVYMAECPETTCGATYIGETARRLELRISEHSGKDEHSVMLRHSLDKCHQAVKLKDFKILTDNRSNSTYSRKIKESLTIRKYHPQLNIQHSSVQLKLFNST